MAFGCMLSTLSPMSVCVYQKGKETERESTLDYCVEVKIYVSVWVCVCARAQATDISQLRRYNAQTLNPLYVFMVRTLCLLLMLCVAQALSLMFHLPTAHPQWIQCLECARLACFCMSSSCCTIKLSFTSCFWSKRILHVMYDGELCELYATIE